MTKILCEPLLGGEPFEWDTDEHPPNYREDDDHQELLNLIKEAANGRRKSAYLREAEAETVATCAGLDEVYAPYVQEKHAKIGVNVGGKISPITEQDKEDFSKLLAHVREWELVFPDQGWLVAPQIVASFLIGEHAKGADIKRLHRSISKMHQAHLDPTNDAAVRGVFEYLTKDEDKPSDEKKDS
jgi:hypothetical protein